MSYDPCDRGATVLELRELSSRHAALEMFLRSPGAQHVNDTERVLLRQRERAMDDYLYALRLQVRLWGVQ